METQEEYLYHYINELRRESAITPPDELSKRDVEFAKQLVEAHQDAPHPAIKRRMWQQALAQTKDHDKVFIEEETIRQDELSEERPSFFGGYGPRRRTFPLTAAASLVVAVLAGLFIALVGTPDDTTLSVTNLVATQVSSQDVPEGFRPVVIASVAMAPGTQISEEMLMTVMWPEAMPLPGPVFADPDELIGMYVRGQTSQTMPLLEFNMTEDTPQSFEMPEKIVTEV